MEKHQMKQLYQDIDVPKAELKNVIHSAAVRAGKKAPSDGDGDEK